MKRIHVLVAMGFLFMACTSTEQMISVAELPPAVIAAVEAEVPGLVITEVTREMEKDGMVYEIEGTAGDLEYEIEVLEDGTIVEVEAETRDDD